VALLLHALGVNMEDIMQDYLLSAPTDGLNDPRIAGLQVLFGKMVGLQLSAKCIRPILDVEPAYLMAALDVISQQYGSIEQYLKQVAGVDQVWIDDLRRMYLT